VRKAGRPVALLLLAASVAACHRQRTEVRYVPSAPPPPPTAFRAAVFLQVFDQRPPDRGGLDSTRVGWTAGNYGIPKRMRVDGAAVARNVWTASADALAQQAIGASTGPTRLIATVLEFWEDGLGTGTHVVVRYQLLDAAGRERWTATVRSGSGEPADPSGPAPARTADAPSVDVFTYALAELAARARAQFATPAFQQALAR
jgi:hypothetical protein